MQLLTVNISGKVRREQLDGKSYLVAPLSMIVPGVLNGSKGSLLYPLEEISESSTAWNGMPIVLGHPTTDGGLPVSARSPQILQSYGMGTVFNAHVNGKLSAEGWFDEEKTKRIAPEVYNQVISGRPVELSTGLFTDNDPVDNKDNAVFNGKPYTHIARNYRPDHLAVLVGKRGACSLEDGCGVNVNQESSDDGDKNDDGGGSDDKLSDNAFCPTGPGGGIDPSCGKGGKKASGGKAFRRDKEKLNIDEARTLLSEKGIKLGRGDTNLDTGVTSYEITEKSGQKRMATTDEIKSMIKDGKKVSGGNASVEDITSTGDVEVKSIDEVPPGVDRSGFPDDIPLFKDKKRGKYVSRGEMIKELPNEVADAPKMDKFVSDGASRNVKFADGGQKVTAEVLSHQHFPSDGGYIGSKFQVELETTRAISQTEMMRAYNLAEASRNRKLVAKEGKNRGSAALRDLGIKKITLKYGKREHIKEKPQTDVFRTVDSSPVGNQWYDLIANEEDLDPYIQWDGTDNTCEDCGPDCGCDDCQEKYAVNWSSLIGTKQKTWAEMIGNFDPNQPRDEKGRFTSGGGGGSFIKSAPAAISKRILDTTDDDIAAAIDNLGGETRELARYGHENGLSPHPSELERFANADDMSGKRLSMVGDDGILTVDKHGGWEFAHTDRHGPGSTAGQGIDDLKSFIEKGEVRVGGKLKKRDKPALGLKIEENKGFDELERRFSSPNQSDWGGKGFLTSKLKDTLGVTRKRAAEIHEKWADSRTDNARANVSPSKACKILKDGHVNGKPLSKKQRGMFGAICNQLTSNRRDDMPLSKQQKDKIIDDLINNNPGGPWDEDDIQALNHVPEEKLLAMNSQRELVINAMDEDEEDDEDMPEVVKKKIENKKAMKHNEQTTNAAPKKKSFQDFMAEAPDEIRSVVNNAIALEKQRKENLIKTITKNEKSKVFSKEYLESRSLEELQGLATICANEEEVQRQSGAHIPVLANSYAGIPGPMVTNLGEDFAKEDMDMAPEAFDWE